MWPPKGTNGCKITSFEPLSVKIVPKLWQTDRQTDRYVNLKNPHKTCFFTHAQIRNGRIDSNQILHINSLEVVVIYLTWHRNWLRGFGGVGCENWPLPLVSNTAYCATAQYAVLEASARPHDSDTTHHSGGGGNVQVLAPVEFAC